MATKTERSSPGGRSRVRDDEWSRWIDAFDDAADDAERERVLADFVAEFSRTLSGAKRHWPSVVSLLRSMAAGEGLAAELAGEPSVLVDEVRLPRFDDTDVLAESGLRANVRARVFETELLTAAAVSQMLGSTSKNPRQLANRWRSSGRLLGVPHRGQYLYPSFQLDVERQGLREAAEHVNALLDSAADPWGVASWWLAPNGRLGGSVPAEMLGDEARESDLVAAARSLAEDDAA